MTIPAELTRRAYLDALDIDVFVPRDETPVGTSAAPTAAMSTVDFTALRDAVARCTRCALHESRTQTVFGVGDPSADWMIIGEAPGAEEDRRGEPFVGRAGKLLDEMLRAVGLSRETVFIANVLKCRPPGNRDPSKAEAAACRSYLDQQIAAVAPRLILVVGRVAAQELLGSDAPVGRLRGNEHDFNGTPLVVTYHPAYLLRSPVQKAKVWEDLKLARRSAERGAR